MQNTGTAAGAILTSLNELGIEYIFANLGTDHAPLLEEMARRDILGQPYPKVVRCPHENLAAHMALGYAMVSGRAQAVLVHVDVGTANSALAAHNALRTRVPLLLIAGRAPYSSNEERPGTRDTYVHFIQEPFDQASIVRPFLKWEYNLPDGEMTEVALQRAYSVAMTAPCGVSYLTIAREVMAQPIHGSGVSSARGDRAGFRPITPANLDAQQISQILDRLETAENPLLITAYSGRNPDTPQVLADLATLAGIRVVEFNPVYMNLATDHPCHAGYDALPFLEDADFGILLDVDVPWIPRYAKLRPDGFWIQIDADPVKQDVPLWPFTAHQRYAADSHGALVQLLAALKERQANAWVGSARQRVQRYRETHASRFEALDARASTQGVPGAINPDYACARIRELAGPGARIINEGVRHAYTVLNQMRPTQGGSMLSTGGGGLGYSSGVALGAKLADPGQLVIQFVGDGGFYFNNPLAALSVSQEYQIPILIVILDNGGWSAVKEATKRVYPEGEANRQDRFHANLRSQVNFAHIAHAVGAHGQLVEDPEALDGAVGQALAAIQHGKTAVLHLKITSL